VLVKEGLYTVCDLAEAKAGMSWERGFTKKRRPNMGEEAGRRINTNVMLEETVAH
jgi:hypothetical protein